MKNLIYKLLDFLFISIILLFTVGVSLQDNPPPGWYQQTLPVNKSITDIFFIDSLKGWVVTTWAPQYDTGYIMHTTNGGDNWIVQFKPHVSFLAVQFLDEYTGYAGGGDGNTKLFKTTNGGDNWFLTSPTLTKKITDIYFINKDTGWICDEDPLLGGLNKTTNGGVSWVQQLNESYWSLKVFFINKDTGWVGTYSSNRLYRTTNGGTNWNLQYTSNTSVQSIFFINEYNGWIRGGTGNGVLYTTDGGFNWSNAQGNVAAGFDLVFINDTLGYSGMQSWEIPKSTDGGRTWGYQVSPIYNNMSVSVFKNNLHWGWAGGTGIVHTTDGGGEIIYSGIKQVSNKIPKDFILQQNYPNPFNSTTIIKFEIRKSSNVKLIIYDIQGKQVDNLVDEKLSSGVYSYDWNASGIPSGIYFYSLLVEGNIINTKKMILIK